MMTEFVILTFSLTVVDAPMVERLMDVLSAIRLNAPMMLSPPTFGKIAPALPPAAHNLLHVTEIDAQASRVDTIIYNSELEHELIHWCVHCTSYTLCTMVRQRALGTTHQTSLRHYSRRVNWRIFEQFGSLRNNNNNNKISKISH